MLQDRIRIDAHREKLIGHALYAAVGSADDVRAFMRWHVFCVWDFQTLIKALQRGLTCVEIPWKATSDSAARRLVNEIVLDEESDEDGRGGYASHFELYHAAMKDCGADTGPIDRLIAVLASGASLDRALEVAEAPPAVAAFVRRTIALAGSGELPSICADFAYGREDVIPDMFRRLVASLAAQDPALFGRLVYYLDRHIVTDGGKHGPLSKRLLERLCGADAEKWARAEGVARAALESRLALWDEILPSLPSRRAPVGAAA